MNNTITNLWYGNIRPAERSGANDREIRESDSLVSKTFRELEKTLDEKQTEALERYSDNVSENISLYQEQAFFDGFRLCARLLTEALAAES